MEYHQYGDARLRVVLLRISALDIADDDLLWYDNEDCWHRATQLGCHTTGKSGRSSQSQSWQHSRHHHHLARECREYGTDIGAGTCAAAIITCSLAP